MGPNSPAPPQPPPYKNKQKILSINSPTKPINNRINNNIGPKQKAFNSFVDSDCRQRSLQAREIIRLQEIGKTEFDQTARTTDENLKSLIHEVYQLNGTSTQIETAIAQQCMRQKRLALPNSNLDGAKKASSIFKNPSKCGTIKADLDEVERRRIESPGSEKFLNDLQEQQYTLMREMKAAGCFNIAG